MIELYYAVSDRKTGEEIHRDHGIFESMEDFYSYMDFRYGYTIRDYTFMLSGRDVN